MQYSSTAPQTTYYKLSQHLFKFKSIAGLLYLSALVQ